jgi:hypothetical protein
METQRIYEDKIMNNHLLSSHNLLGYIDRKLQGVNGQITVDMSPMGNSAGLGLAGHPYEMEQIENLLKAD